ncbi:zinc finger, CCHC-type containing protein [Tanacetum coccineum]
MRDENPIRTLGDYSKPSHEGYRNTIELPIGNKSEDPNQHLKDFLKLVDLLVLNVANRERTRLRLFQFSLRDQASNWLERLPAGSITTWEDLTTRFLAQFFPPGRTAKLRNNILMFQQHRGESLSEAWTRFKDLLQKVPHHVIDRWLHIQFFYDHVSFHLKRIRQTGQAISTPQPTSKTPDQRLLELEDQIKFLLKGSQSTPRPSSTQVPQAYAEPVYSNTRLQNQNEPPKQNPFTFHECTGPNPQPQALGTTFEARVQDYMAAHTERIERFENAIFKHREEINDRMPEMFGLLKELTTSRALEKVLIREEVAEHVYPMDFVILDIKEDKNRPFILGTPFLTMAKAVIKFYKGTITLRLVLEWEERIKLHLEREMEFDQWKSKIFKGKHPALVKVEGGMDDEGEVTKFLIKNEEEIFTDAGDGVASPAM